ncbi:MAG TPA: hypothetical protein VE153_03820, partial [Myxococcus sp.]|nr:hypothetical protein [Myxococcus sp.]
PSRGEAPVTGRAPSPALAGASAARGRALLLGLGGVCLVLAGALGAVLLMPVQAGMGARDDAPMAAGQDEGSAVAEVRTAEARGAGAVNSPAQGAGASEAPVQGAGTAGASVQGAGAAGAPVQGTGTAEAWAQGAGAAEASAQGVGTPEAVGAASTARLADGQEAGAEDAPVPPAEEPAPTYERVTVDKVYEVLEDRGDHYLRAGGADGVGLGTEVRLLGLAESDGRRPLYGEAVVMELKGERLARLRPDKRPPAGSALFASFTPEPPKDKPRPTPRRQELRTAREPAAPTPVAAAQPVAAAPEPPPLQGRADVSGFGPVRRVIIYNREQRPWTRCELRLPNNRRFSLDKLAAGDQLAIALVKFRQDGPGQDLPLTWVSITCEQGRAKLSLRGG